MIIVNFIFFQICWAACVWGGASGYWWLGPAVVTAFLIWEMRRSQQVSRDLLMLAVIALLGFAVDTGYVASGLLEFASPVPFSAAAPVWIVTMWISFGLTLNHSMAWMKNRYLLGAVFGFVGGPLAYWIAWKAWSAVFFNVPLVQMMLVIGIVWAIVTPILLWIAEKTQPTLQPALSE